MWIRVQLPNRPGSLGRLATELGRAEVDIVSIEVVDRDEDTIVNDIMIDLASGSSARPPDLRAVCQSVPGCVVETVRPYVRGGGVDRDLAALQRMASRPDHALETLLHAAPLIFRSHWAAIVDTSTGTVRSSTPGAPGPTYFTRLLSETDDLRRTPPRASAPLPTIAVMLEPLTSSDSFVVGRRAGPSFFDSEILRLRYLIAAAQAEEQRSLLISLR